MWHVVLLFLNVQFLLLDWELFSSEELESFVSEGPKKKVMKNFLKPREFLMTIFFETIQTLC